MAGWIKTGIRLCGCTLGVPCVLYMLSAPGPRHTVNITENSSAAVQSGPRLC